MGKLATAERVSRDASDNFVFQRSLLAYDRAAEIVSGDVLEIGTGTGYGIELVAPHCDRFVTVDKYAAAGDRHAANVEFRRMCVPPLGFEDESFDFVITFQVIEHIDDDAAFVREIARVLRPGGRLILTTPNAPMSLTRNPWHIREYTAAPVFMERGSKGAHEWIVEFDTPPDDAERFTDTLDRALQSVNSDYEAKRFKDTPLMRPTLTVVPPGTFYRWMKSRGKAGGQNKVPRLFNDRTYIDQLIADERSNYPK